MTLDYFGILASSMPFEVVNLEVMNSFQVKDHVDKYKFRQKMCTRSSMNVIEEAGVSLLDDFNVQFQKLESICKMQLQRIM
jgi:hypothetical protein